MQTTEHKDLLHLLIKNIVFDIDVMVKVSNMVKTF